MKYFLMLLACCAVAASAQNNPDAKVARDWRMKHEQAIVSEFASLLAVPNVSNDKANVQRNADLIVEMLSKRGVAARTVTVPGANPMVFGEIKSPGATRTLVFYVHYDGQPLDPKEWATAPFTPTLRTRALEQGGEIIPLDNLPTLIDPESRIYARSASDDKAPIIALLTALDALNAAGLKPRSNIKFAFEGEEEAGSTNIVKILSANKSLFSGDIWLNIDGPMHQTGRQAIVFGDRGIVSVEITVYGPRSELHSGHYGNWAPNPALMLAKLLASMKDDDGRVLIDHYYDGIEPLGEAERLAIAEAPDIDAELMRQMWLGSTEGAPKKLAELITLPSLNIRGMSSARTGRQAANVVPATATADIDARIVHGMDKELTAQRIVEHIRKQGFFVVDSEPGADVRTAHPKVAMVKVSTGSDPIRTPMNLPISQDVIRTVESVRGPAVKIPNTGASGAQGKMEATLGVKSINIPVANFDNHQHSANENLRIQNLWDAIELMAALLRM
jgi:acetylornithine deacetylase/succinyl-diaminopimelate desuccinylase-like protein